MPGVMSRADDGHPPKRLHTWPPSNSKADGLWVTGFVLMASDGMVTSAPGSGRRARVQVGAELVPVQEMKQKKNNEIKEIKR